MLKTRHFDILEVLNTWRESGVPRKLGELALAALVGLMLGALLVYSSGLSSDWQGMVLVVPVAFAFIMVFNNLEKLVLVGIAIGIPLNLDFSVIVSPYSINPENVARGNRTIIALTELRVGLISILLVIGYALWLVKPRGIGRKSVRFFPATTIPALGLIFVLILSVIQAQDKQLAFFRIEQLIEAFLLYFYVANHIKTILDLRFFMMVSLGAMLAESLLMIIQWATNLTFSFAGIEAMELGPGRIGGTLGHTGPAAGYLSVMILLACSGLWSLVKGSHRVLALACVFLGITALVSTGSRIGMSAAAVTLLAFILVGLRFGLIKRETLVLLFVLILAFGFIFSSEIYTRFTADDNGSASARPMMWNLAIKIIEANPWLGVGAGNYALATRDYYSPDIGRADEVIDIQVHDAYLGVAGEGGIFALLFYLGMLGAAFFNAWSCAVSRSRFISLMGIGISLGIISLCIQMVTGTFHMRSITLFLWLVIALAASLRTIKDLEPSAI